MLILTEKVFRHPGVTMKSSFYLKLGSKAARVTTAEHTQVFQRLGSYKEDTMWVLTNTDTAALCMATACFPLGNKTCISSSSSSGKWAERGRSAWLDHLILTWIATTYSL